jgi:hypothetical protein
MIKDIPCHKCNQVTVKDFYRELWICTNPKCDVCDIE